MNPLDFLAVVLPSPGHGYYCAAELTTPNKKHKFALTLEEHLNNINSLADKQLDTFGAMATFEQSGNRLADNAAYIKCIFVDIDCNHKLDIPDENGHINPREYPSAKAAVSALAEFLQTTGLDTLGEPWLASSGGGVHAYWPLNEAVDITTWRPVAENFKSLCIQHNLKIDATVTADAARVMRFLNTTNNGIKGKKQVRGTTVSRLVSEGTVFDLEEFASIVRSKLTLPSYEKKRAMTLDLPGKRPTKREAGATSVKLMANSVTSFKTIWLKSEQGEGCNQFKAYLDNPTKDGLEPMWRGLLSWAKCCEEDGWGSAAEFSAMHPYDEDRLQTKWQEIKGPYPCLKMDGENPGVCGGCAHFGKIVNPLVLGRKLVVDNTERELSMAPREVPKPKQKQTASVFTPVEDDEQDYVEDEVDVDTEIALAQDASVPTVRRPTPPRGFSYGREGGVYVDKSVEDADGRTITKQTMLLPYDLFVVDLLNTKGEHTVHMLYNRPEGLSPVVMAQKAVVSKDETVKQLAAQNVIATFGSGNDKNLFEYVRACVADASVNKRAIKVPDHFGWQEDDTYVHNANIYAYGKKPAAVPMAGLENITYGTRKTGTLDGWRSFINLLINKKQYDILAIILVSAGSPLMRFTGINGMTFHVGSTNSGTGKSMALDGGASIWGHPTAYRVGKDTSPVAMQQRLGLLHSMPLITDEITQKSRGDIEWAPSFLFDMSEGKGKERMESGANRERLNTTYWKAMALLSSNTHMTDMLTGARSHSSQGELRRLLELTMERELSWTAEEVEVIKSLQNNYGVVAPPYIQYMVDNFDEVSALTNSTVKRMYTALEATNDERFWVAGVGACMTAGIIFGERYAGIIDLPMGEILESYKRMVNKMRAVTRESVRTADDVLNTYIRENYGSFVSVRFIDKAWTASIAGGEGNAVNQSLTRSKVAGRVEFNVKPGFVDFYIEERVLRTHCSAMSFGYADLKTQLEAQHTVSYLKKDMTSKTTGPSMRVNAICISQRTQDVDKDLLPVAED